MLFPYLFFLLFIIVTDDHWLFFYHLLWFHRLIPNWCQAQYFSPVPRVYINQSFSTGRRTAEKIFLPDFYRKIKTSAHAIAKFPSIFTTSSSNVISTNSSLGQSDSMHTTPLPFNPRLKNPSPSAKCRRKCLSF